VTGIQIHTNSQRANELAASIGRKTDRYSKHLLIAYRVARLQKLPTAIAQHAATGEQAEMLFMKLEALAAQLPSHTSTPNTQHMMEYLADFNAMAHELKAQLGLVHYSPRKSMAMGAAAGAILSAPLVVMKPVLWEAIIFSGVATGMAVGIGIHYLQIQHARKKGKCF
jgi:hypothetical protein